VGQDGDVNDPDATAAQVFVTEATSLFHFLMDEYGFHGPIVEDVPFAVWVVFNGREAAVKVAFDTRDRLIETFLVRLVNGDLPPYDETEATHYVGTESLAALSARELALADATLARSTSEDFRRVLGWHADVIQEFGDVLRGDFRRFDQAISERTAYIAAAERQYQRELLEEATARPPTRLERWFRRWRRS
jgi:hypothetical protein